MSDLSDDSYEPNPRYVEAMAAILIRLMVPSEGYEEEAVAARGFVIETNLFIGMPEQDTVRIMAKLYKAHRAGTTTGVELDSYAKSLPMRLRQTLLAKYAIHLANAYDGNFPERKVDEFQALGEFLEIATEQVHKIIEVAQITYSRII